MTRTARELAWGAAALILLSPLIPALAPTVAAWIFHTKLAVLPPPYASLSVAADIFTHDKLRLITGHGFETVSRGVRAQILPAHTPKALAFMIWYELGVVGAALAAVGVWFAFRNLDRAPPRLAPFMAAGFSRDRRALVSERRFRRYDDVDPDCGRGHFDRRRGAQPVPHDAAFGRYARQPVSNGAWLGQLALRPRHLSACLKS